jgi:hypothetical protein
MAGGRRLRQGVPAIGELYGIEAVTRRIDDLYERLMAVRSRARSHGRVLASSLGGNR